MDPDTGLKKSFKKSADLCGAKTCFCLLEEYRKKYKLNENLKIQEIDFNKRKNHRIDHYNPTKIQRIAGQELIAVREESRHSETDSRVRFFAKIHGRWQKIKNAPVLGSIQDPFYCGEIQGVKIFGGVRINPISDKVITCRTVFFKYVKNINELEQFAQGPEGMKDIRLIELKSGRIAVFTRPRGGEYGHGQVGYLEIDKLEELEAAVNDLSRAKIIEGLFHENEWGGVNDLHLLEDDRIGVIGHIAHFQEDGKKNYYATASVFDPKSQKMTSLEIILSAEGLPFEPKNNELNHIVFPGGSIRNDDGSMELYAGIGDTHAVRVEMPDPFQGAKFAK